MGLYYEIRGSIYPIIYKNFDEIIVSVKNKSIYDDLIRIKEELNNMNDRLNNFDLSFLPDEFNKDSIELKYIFMNIPWSEIEDAYDGDDVLYKYEKMIPITNRFNGSKCSQSWMSSPLEKDMFANLHCTGVDCEDCLRKTLYPYRNYFLNK